MFNEYSECDYATKSVICTFSHVIADAIAWAGLSCGHCPLGGQLVHQRLLPQASSASAVMLAAVVLYASSNSPGPSPLAQGLLFRHHGDRTP